MIKTNIHDKVARVRNAINAVPGCVAAGMILETSFGEVPKLTIDVFLNEFEDYIGSHSNIGIGVEKIIFNPPATIVFWTDGTKTVVKAMDGTEYNPYFGFYAAVTKKIFGNNHRIEKCIKDKGCPEIIVKKMVMEEHPRKAVKEVMDERGVINVDNVSKIRKEIRVECANHRTCVDCPLFEHTKDNADLCYSDLDLEHLLEHYRIMFYKEWKGEIEE